MQKINVGIGSIDRSVDGGVSKDGLTAELINMRVTASSVEPVGSPILLQQFAREPVYIHKNSGYEHYICYNGTSLTYDYKRENGKFIATGGVIVEVSKLVSVESIGNMLIIISESGIGYALYKNGAYSYIGEKPELPCLLFTQNVETRGTNEYAGSFSKTEGEDAYKIAASGMFYKLKNQIEGNGYLHETMYIRYGLRLVDGSIILGSPVTALRGGGGRIDFNTTGADDGQVKAWVGITGYYTLSYKTLDTKSIASWSDLVQSIDVFAAFRPIIDAENPPFKTKFGTEYFPEVGNLSSNFSTVDNYYLIHSIGIGDLSSGTISIPKEVLQNIEQQETMPLDDFSHNTVSGNVSYVYNGRLHLGDITTKLFNGFDARYYQNAVEVSQSYPSSSVEITIVTENGNERILSDKETFTGRLLSPVLAYPDYRATGMTIRDGSGKGKTVRLQKHPFLNMAYYQEPTLSAIDLTDSTSSSGTSDNSPTREPNKIKVSALNNPLSFPVANTYTVSNGDIVGMASATSALSTGQFGQFPVYVFATDGVYALEVGNGDVVYARSTPVTRDVCANSKTITATDDAIVFATEESLVLLQGSTSTNLSTMIEGYLPTFIDSSPQLKKVAGIPNLDNSLSAIEFRTYIKDAVVGYSYNDKEIIVSNENYDYSYVYNMKSGGWYKTSHRVRMFLNSYPECFAYFEDGGVYDMYNPHRTVNNILLITKPIKFGSLVHKRILQSAIRGMIRPSLSDLYYKGEPVMFRDQPVQIFSNCGFYVFGSNDAEHFTLVAGKEKIVDIRDLITKMNKSKAYKYFVVALAGGVRTDVAFNYFEFILDDTYTNRLR